jgi:deazaflavin-dependent oxidoreductase (nitroreductase family)
MVAYDDLPYNPVARRAIVPLRRGFSVLNRHAMAPALRAGLGPFLSTGATGSMLLLRTTGRRSGLVRETPLGYAVVGGRVVVVAGYGRRADWYRNALACPQVEVVLPGAVLRGTAEPITDPTTFRTTIEAMRLPGRLTVGDLSRATPERLDEMAEGFPMLAIAPTAILPGPFDPGGWIARANTVAQLGAPLLGVAWLAWRLARPAGRGGRDRAGRRGAGR